MSSISRVAIVGAAGSLGSVIFKRLVESGDFKVTVLRRLGSKSTYPADVEVADVDFSSLQSLESALRGQDAVVSTIGNMGFMDQWTLVDAAAAAGVKRFIPSGFGSDLDNPKTQQLPVFADKIKVDNHLTEVCKGSKMTWTTVSNSAFLDWGLEKGFILNLHVQNPQILDGGDLPFSTTTLSTVADAVVGIFKHPAETENRTVFVHDLVTTQNQLLALAKKALPTRSWEPTHASIDDLIQKSNTQLREGNIDGGTFLSYLWRSILTPGYGGEFKKTDNELLGIPLKDEAFVINVIKSVME